MTTSGQPSLLTISQASRFLGVSEVTLRQWTDEGRIEAFITPGGHRRYSQAELRRFMGSGNRIHGIKIHTFSLGGTTDTYFLNKLAEQSGGQYRRIRAK